MDLDSGKGLIKNHWLKVMESELVYYFSRLDLEDNWSGFPLQSQGNSVMIYMVVSRCSWSAYSKE